MSERTVYLESFDGQYGIAVQTATAEDNVYDQYDHVQILIQGASGYLVENPDRYDCATSPRPWSFRVSRVRLRTCP